ncbi:MAG TPA: hypothetical protein V6D15_20925 [Oculatellaceae cyanobacterium]|jgi:beta-lactamase class A
MSYKADGKLNKREQEIAELEKKLDLADQLIKKLRRQNTVLKNRIAFLKNNSDPHPALPNSRVSNPRSKNREYPPGKGGALVRRQIRTIKLWRLRVATIAIALLGFTLINWAVSSLTKRSPNQKSPRSVAAGLASASLSEQQSTIPAWAKASSEDIPTRQSGKENLEVVYNLTTPPKFQYSKKLQIIVDELVAIADNKKLPTRNLSITLIDAKTGEIAGYQQSELRYPASVIKMFWMVALYGQLENGIWKNPQDFNLYISKMIENSDNDTSSFILDHITNTQSQGKLPNNQFTVWLNQRNSVNRFFRSAGYEGININQKTYPIYYLRMEEPEGTELQMRGGSERPLRNVITTDHSARLIYEICVLKQAISPAASEKMCGLLKRDLKPEVWKTNSETSEEFNPIVGFSGQSLPDSKVDFYSKAGLTSTTRQEAAFVATKDNSTAYVLAIGGGDRAYSSDYKIFPKMSSVVFERMTNRAGG